MGVGLIRLLLAFSVVVTHTSPILGFNVANGVVAVRTFYIISGFYMALILDKKYKNIILFYRNRALRIYPIYLLLLLLTVLFSFFAHALKGVWGELGFWVENAKSMSPITWVEVVGANLTIYGRDLIMFSGFDNIKGNLFFRPDVNYSLEAYKFLLIPQAWTIVLEVQFYIIVPLLVKFRNYLLVVLIFLSLLVRYAMTVFGFTSVYWTNRFFLSELVFFLMGIVSYRIYQKTIKLKLPKLSLISAIVLIGFLLMYNFAYAKIGNIEGSFYVVFMLLLPLVFKYSKSSKFDRTLGDLSYPVYLSHILIITIVYPGLYNSIFNNKNFLAPIVMLVCMVFSYFLNFVFQTRIEKLRSVGQ